MGARARVCVCGCVQGQVSSLPTFVVLKWRQKCVYLDVHPGTKVSTRRFQLSKLIYLLVDGSELDLHSSEHHHRMRRRSLAARQRRIKLCWNRALETFVPRCTQADATVFPIESRMSIFAIDINFLPVKTKWILEPFPFTAFVSISIRIYSGKLALTHKAFSFADSDRTTIICLTDG